VQPAGVEVGRYRVTRRIGKGGMAEVFEAVAPGPDGFERRVAIKRLLDSHAIDPAFGRMFLDEARIASQLHHAHVVAVLDYGVADGHPFQVLEYIDGVDLNGLLELGRAADAPLPVELALAICTDIAHALDYAHRALGADGRPLGIVHRDVSPANILVGWSGDVKLSDFGIAFARGRVEETAAGLAKGTLLYMAPEQLMRGELDGRTDVFALGCVLHRLIAGASPLAGETAMADLVAGAPLPLAPTLPDDARAIVARATRRARADRYPDAAGMAEALGQALARRIDTDPRSRMRAWLALIMPGAAPAPAAGRLDPLLGVDLVFSGVRATEEARSNGASTGVPARRPYFWAKALAATVPILAGVLALAFWPRDPETAAAPDAPTATVTVTATVPATVPVPAPDAPPADAPRAHPVRAPARLAPRTPAPAASVDTGTGVLAIGGTGALRAAIEVDGQRRGYAPRALDLSVGDHEIVLVRPDGQRLSRLVHVEPSHTPSAPLRWTVP
jgi:Protein kinase domain